MRIYVEVRNIPEIKEAFNQRVNKKDSFNRWLRKFNPTITFNDMKWMDIINEY